MHFLFLYYVKRIGDNVFIQLVSVLFYLHPLSVLCKCRDVFAPPQAVRGVLEKYRLEGTVIEIQMICFREDEIYVYIYCEIESLSYSGVAICFPVISLV